MVTARQPWRGLFLAVCLAVLAASQRTPAQEAQEKPDTLSVDQAVSIALANNRNLKIVSLTVESSKEKLLADKTHRLPSFSTYVFGSETLTPINFTIRTGQLGTYAATGPIPSHDMQLSTGDTPTAYILASVSQPLLTLYKINLHVRGQELTVEQDAAKLREQRQTLVAQVRQAYYQLLQVESSIDSAQSNIKQYEELDRITLQYVSEQTALKSETLDVKAKLAQQQYSLLQYQDKLQYAKENLNDLLGRDLNTDFHTVAVSEMSLEEVDLKAAQAKALEQHPQLKEAEITVEQADNARRQAKAQYMPDLNAAIHYISPFGVEFLPSNVAAVGLEFSWEPFDWGRRKHTVNEKVMALEQSKLNLTESKAQVLLNVDNQFRLLHEARIAVAVATTQKESTREKLREVTLQYEQKAALLRDVLQQQAAFEGAEAQYDQALASFWTSKANFQKALGEE